MPNIVSNENVTKQPFLSVVIRTQGKRIECLKEALLCLTAQSDQDFEVLIVQHGPRVSKDVRAVLDLQPDTLNAKLHAYSVSGGKRAVPLNVGVRASTGSYIAFFDDDDLLFANWVEEFRKQATISPGTVLRAQVATLQVQAEKWPLSGTLGLRTTGWPHAEYAKSFSRVDHILVNHSPFMGLAFPRTLFTNHGLSFDESLSVCEDWDFLLRASSILPVSDVNYLTALYRRWQGQETSYTIHDQNEWRSSELSVVSKLINSEMVLRDKDIARVRELLETEQQLTQLHRLLHVEQTYLLMQQSLSWKITSPLRSIRPKLNWFFNKN